MQRVVIFGLLIGWMGLAWSAGCSSSEEGCEPDTCSDLGVECGAWDDGCGGTAQCGTCPAGQSCDANGQCQVVCTPDCADTCCGPDGCGGTCPDTCAATGQVCDPQSCTCEGACQPLTCAQLGKACGDWPDGCGDTAQCGTCPAGQSCDANGQCQVVCTPDCAEKCCGPDGCGGTCPDACAATGQVCDPQSCTCEGACQPQSCAQLGMACGDWPDGCGGTLQCGSCPAGQSCDANGQCQVVCQPQSCAQLGKACGQWPDGCGGTLQCGSCPAGQSCDANGQCQVVCQPQSCAQLGKACGQWPDGCGGTLQCGSCPAGQSCDANGQCQNICTPNCAGRCCGPDGCGGTCPDACAATGQVCDPQSCTCQNPCQPQSCAQLGKACGQWPDGCGGTLQCGSCPAGQSCDANGQCQVVCQPQSCAQLGKACGDWPDGCGGTAHCGGCPTGYACNAMGVCQEVCQPTSCAAQGYACGPLYDGCGTTLNCGTCPSGQVCTQGQCRSNVPALSLLTQNGGTFTLRWTFNWPPIGSTSDRHQLQESTTGPDSGFALILETPANDHHMPWDHTLTRSSGTYYYRVRTYSTSSWTAWSNVVSVSVNAQPARLRIINDLTNQTSGGFNWGNMNQLIRIYMADDINALNNCTDACDRLEPPSGCSAPGATLAAGGAQRDFDVSMYTDGSYCVFIQTGYWDYFCAEGFCCWEEHLTQVLNCAGQCCAYKWAYFCVNGHFEGTFTVPASDWLPQQSWAGTPFCN